MAHKIVISLLFLTLVAGCQQPPPTADFAELTFRHLPAWSLAVERVDVVDRVPDAGPGRVEQRFPVAPARVVAAWPRDRLVATGGFEAAVFEILDATATESALPRTTGLAGLVTTDQSERYDLRLAARLSIIDRAGQVLARIEAEARRSSTVPENATLHEREAVWFGLTEAAARDLDTELARQLPRHLAPWL